MSRFLRRPRMAVCAALALTGCAPSATQDCIKVGVLTAFTGAQGANGFNVERVVQLVQQRVEQAGGVMGRPLCVVYADTHSDPRRARAAAERLLDDEQVIALVGPDDLDAVRAVQPAVEERSALALLPGISARQKLTLSAGTALQVGPAAESLGCAAGERIYDSGYRKVVVVHSGDATSELVGVSVAPSVERYMRATSPAVVHTLRTAEDASSYAELARDVELLRPDAVLLVLSTRAASRFLQDWPAGAEVNPSWFFGPGLLNDVLLTNVTAGLLEGANGLSPSSENQHDLAELRLEYERQFGGAPFPVSAYFYDAAALLVLAVEEAGRLQGGKVPSGAQVAIQLRRVSTSPGKRIIWNALAEGLGLVRAGQDVDYHGVSGALTINPAGELDRSSAVFTVERVTDGAVTFASFDACSF